MKLARMPDGSPEIFHTLQGEGRCIGRPSVFIRASLCNLHCQWCDTPYTWNWEGTNFETDGGQKFKREEQIIDLSPGEVAEAASQYPCSNYVFTGGEPLIQEKAWLELMGILSGHFEIETNGTLFPSEEFIGKIHQINVSPKLSNSGVPEKQRHQPEVLQKLAATGKADFKFVIGNREDFAEVESLSSEAGLPADRIFLMPKANSVTELEANQSIVASLSQENGMNFSDRLHLRLFGAGRGV